MSEQLENIDNPAVPDVDVDAPVAVPPQAEPQPVVEPDPVTEASGELGQDAGAVTYQETPTEDGGIERVAVATPVEDIGEADTVDDPDEDVTTTPPIPQDRPDTDD